MLTGGELLGQADMEEQLFPARRPPALSAEATELLHRHANAHGLPDLRPHQFAFGFVVADLYAQGWTYPRFCGEPNGGEPGEMLGPDIAILRQYEQAAHGARSTVATFLEKYVWAACNRLFGYLSDRLPLSLSGQTVSPPVDLSLVSWDSTASSRPDRENPIPLAIFRDVMPVVELSSPLQFDRAIEWIREAPLRYPRVMHSFDAEAPAWLRTGEWLVLRAVARVRDPDSQADTHIALSGFVYDAAHREMIEQDAAVDLPNMHEFHSELRGTGAYKNISEVVWSPRVEEQNGTMYQQTLDDRGTNVEIPLLAASCRFYSQDEEQEDIEQWMPALWLRRALHVSDYRDGRFLARDGQTVAVYASTFGESGEFSEPYTTALLARRDRLAEDPDQRGAGAQMGRPAFPGALPGHPAEIGPKYPQGDRRHHARSVR
ncbi:hypothetical protein [Nannocystis sp.]|uniref:hypothetical protein n=1 Tax=Nannocystis sp. TaxID=1962667 RepID=UPI0025F88FF8|nr:hypothetical protein [Nannocystis sp.]MBK7828410.1 hypothetical protein [Nannocystis sp.]